MPLARLLLYPRRRGAEHTVYASNRRECQDMERDATRSHFGPNLPLAYSGVEAQEPGRWALNHEGHRYESTFHPLVSRAHGRPVAFRAALKNSDPKALVSPNPSLETAATTLHMRQFEALHKGAGAWLLLPVPQAALEDARHWPPVPQDLFASDGYLPSEIMLSVTLGAAPPAVLADFAQFHRELGFTIELRGLSPQQGDLALLWALRPDLVTLSADFLAPRSGEPLALGRLSALITLMHESGAMVALDAVATPEALARALETPVDLLGGPATQPWTPQPARGTPPSGINQDCQRAFEASLAALRQGEIFETACTSLLYQPGVLRCYLLDEAGTQLTENLSPAGTRSDPRYWPLAQAAGASWAHRPYFQPALAQAGAMAISAPYLSLPDGGPCQTLAASFLHGDKRQILCCDLEARTGLGPRAR